MLAWGIALSIVMGAEVRLADLAVVLDLPAGWHHDQTCGPVVPPVAQCRVGDQITTCPDTICPERLGVLWIAAPAVLASKEDETRELLSGDAGSGTFVSSLVLADGWVLTWGGAKWKDTYPFRVSRKIGKRVIECSGEAVTLAGRQVLIDACRSLRAAP